MSGVSGGKQTVTGDVGIVELPTGLLDSFGHIVTGSINNQIDVQFYRDTPANLVTVTEANGGTVTEAGGMATFAATTTASSQAKGVSLTNTRYTAGAEVYCIFTAGFTGTGSGTSYHRIGVYDGSDGFYIGFEAGTFGATIIKGGSPTQTAKASFSEDDLTGGSKSEFTRAGTPEAIDLTKLNVWRIRFGWVGSAPILFEVLSPDGGWVTFHKIKQPNLAALPSIETADIPVTCDVNSGDSSTALTIITNCWTAGTTQSLSPLNDVLVSTDFAQTTKSVISGQDAIAGTFKNVKSFDAAGSFTSLLVVPVDVNGATPSFTANDAVDSGNPIKVGGVARTANPTAVSGGDRVDAAFDDLGRQLVTLGQPRDLTTHSHTAITTTTETTILAAGGAGVFHDLTSLVITNEDNASVIVTIKDSTAGTTRMIISLAPKGGAVMNWPYPVTQATANNNWTATLDVNPANNVNFFVQVLVNV